MKYITSLPYGVEDLLDEGERLTARERTMQVQHYKHYNAWQFHPIALTGWELQVLREGGDIGAHLYCMDMAQSLGHMRRMVQVLTHALVSLQAASDEEDTRYKNMYCHRAETAVKRAIVFGAGKATQFENLMRRRLRDNNVLSNADLHTMFSQHAHQDRYLF
ncbi:hypothetical protein H4R34_004464 [Dimargaris verticillata]|uniref:Uncharacterized protein n=1 Tax=Dimargaris verticillata TaxID=2761393 RepID=A0A9W8E770_9FUNG|nr:hypothetical protein H4R34_004464 [Dimargaris verticillata]